MKAAIEGREMQVEDVVRIADEASEVLQFNRALLQGAIENITQGISVVDQSLRLVALEPPLPGAVRVPGRADLRRPADRRHHPLQR